MSATARKNKPRLYGRVDVHVHVCLLSRFLCGHPSASEASKSRIALLHLHLALQSKSFREQKFHVYILQINVCIVYRQV